MLTSQTYVHAYSDGVREAGGSCNAGMGKWRDRTALADAQRQLVRNEARKEEENHRYESVEEKAEEKEEDGERKRK